MIRLYVLIVIEKFKRYSPNLYITQLYILIVTIEEKYDCILMFLN